MHTDNILVLACQRHFDPNMVVRKINLFDLNPCATVRGITIQYEFGDGGEVL